MRIFFFSSRRRHTRYWRDWSSDVCSSDLYTFLWSRVTVTIVTATTVRAATISVPATTHPRSGESRLVRYESKASSRSEERRVGKECRSGWSQCDDKENGWRGDRSVVGGNN